MDFENGLHKFQKWKPRPAQPFAMAQVYVEEHLNSAGILQVQNLHVLGFMTNFTCKRAVIPIIIALTSSLSREFGFHIWYNLNLHVHTLEKDLNYGVSQMNAFSISSLEAEPIYIQEYMNHRPSRKAGKEQLDCSPKHSTGRQEADHNLSLSPQNFTKTEY